MGNLNHVITGQLKIELIVLCIIIPKTIEKLIYFFFIFFLENSRVNSRPLPFECTLGNMFTIQYITNRVGDIHCTRQARCDKLQLKRVLVRRIDPMSPTQGRPKDQATKTIALSPKILGNPIFFSIRIWYLH